MKSFKFILVILALVMTISLGLAGCGNDTTPATVTTTTTTTQPSTTTTKTTATTVTTSVSGSGTITEAGSTTVQPVAEAIALAFMASHPDIDVIIQGGGSSTGVKSASEGTVDIGAASREVKDSEKGRNPVSRISISSSAPAISTVCRWLQTGRQPRYY